MLEISVARWTDSAFYWASMKCKGINRRLSDMQRCVVESKVV